MPFSHRAFCRISEAPSLSELLIWLRQQGHDAKISGGPSADDLLTCYWNEVLLSTSDEDVPLRLKCLRSSTWTWTWTWTSPSPSPSTSGADPMAEVVGDFLTDVAELPPSAGRERVLQHLETTRAVLVVEFPPHDASPDSEDVAEQLTTLFAERADGLAQRDGVGFLDEDDDLLLALG
jgi:hypothetical protein